MQSPSEANVGFTTQTLAHEDTKGCRRVEGKKTSNGVQSPSDANAGLATQTLAHEDTKGYCRVKGKKTSNGVQSPSEANVGFTTQTLAHEDTKGCRRVEVKKRVTVCRAQARRMLASQRKRWHMRTRKDVVGSREKKTSDGVQSPSEAKVGTQGHESMSK